MAVAVQIGEQATGGPLEQSRAVGAEPRDDRNIGERSVAARCDDRLHTALGRLASQLEPRLPAGVAQ